MTYPTVPLISDGTPANAANTNPSINALAQRTDHILNLVNSLAAGSQLTLRNQTAEAGLVVGTPVYFNDAQARFEKALAIVDTGNYNQSDKRAYWVGVVSTVNGTTIDLVVTGSMSLTTVQWAAVITGGVFAAGDYYLSDTTAGQITTNPNSSGTYAGHMKSDGTFIVKSQTGDSYLQHVHLSRTLLGKPAGSSTNPGVGNPQVINTPNASQQGWLPANNTYFPGYTVGVQIPTGAYFGYNLQHANEASLRAIFPPVPVDSAVVTRAGLTLDGDSIVINNFGIWWMTNTYGNCPWPPDYDTNGNVAPDQTLWTVRIPSSTTLTSIIDAAVNEMFSTAGVTKLKSSDTNAISFSGSGDNTNGYYASVTATYNGSKAILAGNTGLTISGTAGDATNGWRGVVSIGNNGVLTTKVQSGTSGLTISGTSGDATNGWFGNLTITNTGLVGFYDGAGTAMMDSTGDVPVATPSGGFIGKPKLRIDIPIPAQYSMSVLDPAAGSPTLLPLAPASSVGVPAGTYVKTWCPQLGSQSDSYIDYVIQPYRSGFNGTNPNYGKLYLNLIVHPNVATLVAAKSFTVSVYKFNTAGPLNTANLVDSGLVTCPIGSGGGNIVSIPFVTVNAINTTHASVGADLVIVRISNDNGVNGLTLGALRVLAVNYRFY